MLKIHDNKIFKVFISILLIFFINIFIISFSIALVILFRPFYYWHLSQMDLEKLNFEKGKLNYYDLKTSYDQLMNYLITNIDFGVGLLKYSEEGKLHFQDVKKLFIINWILLIASLLIIITFLILNKKINLKFNFIKLSFISSLILIIGFIFLAIIASINFDKSFEIFHKLFFPGKNNWIFDPNKDEIIQILPQAFFRNSAIFIIVNILVLCFSFIILHLVIKHKKKTTKK